jgi:hypothetical protein
MIGRLRARIVLMAASAFAVSACGNVPPDDHVREASEATMRSSSWRVLETGTFDGEATVTRGVVDLDREQARYIIDLGAAPAGAKPREVRNGRLVGEEIHIGSSLYVGGALAEGEKPWMKVESGGLDGETIADDPTAELEQLRTASSDFRVVGESIVRGEPTTHYRGTIAIGAVSGTWEVWIGERHIRRIRFADPEGGESTTEFYDFGVNARIEPPPADLVRIERPPDASCADEPSQPLTADEVARALRRSGFTVSPDPDNVLCGSSRPNEDVVFALTNMNETDTVSHREGLLFCSLRRSPIYGGGSAIQVMDDEVDKKKLVLANLECSVYARGSGGPKQIENLERALEHLRLILRG